jgi:uncharacterized protein (TIGR00661 family)
LPVKINKPTVLIAPLDWGLGHATRCIPVIQAFLKEECNIIIAASGATQQLLQNEFPNLQFIELFGYKIQYSKSRWLLPFNIIFQIPKIIKAIKKEHRWLKKTITQYPIDLVISDNRFGLYSNQVTSVFITHQLTIKAPFVWIEKILRKLNYWFINHFSECWIPDNASDFNLAGDLSHPAEMPDIPASYIGLLSRFKRDASISIKYKYCFLLSGPEPQRTILEKMILKDIDLLKEKVLLVRGKPNSNESLDLTDSIEVRNHLPQNELGQALQQSEYIVCRSGYTSLMEIISLQKKSIVIPTPGQTEQEYLAERLYQQHWCYTIEQKDFHLIHSLESAGEFDYILPEIKNSDLQFFIHQFVEKTSMI